MPLTEPTVGQVRPFRSPSGPAYLVILPRHYVSIIPAGESAEILVHDLHRRPDIEAPETDEHGITYCAAAEVDTYLRRLVAWSRSDGLRKRAGMLRQEAANILREAQALHDEARHIEERAAAVDRYN